MTNDARLSALVRELLHQETLELTPPQNLVPHLHSRLARRNLAKRIIQGSVAVLLLVTGVTALVTATIGRSERGPSRTFAHDTAYVIRHVESEVSALSSGIVEITTKTGDGTVALYHGVDRAWSKNNPSIYTLTKTSTGASIVLRVNGKSKIWWMTSTPSATSAVTTQHSTSTSCNGGSLSLNAFATPAALRQELISEHFAVVGTPTVDGRATIELAQCGNPHSFGEIYVDKKTYAPVKVVQFSRSRTPTTPRATTWLFQSLPPTPALTALFDFTVPSGYTKVPWPHGAGWTAGS